MRKSLRNCEGKKESDRSSTISNEKMWNSLFADIKDIVWLFRMVDLYRRDNTLMSAR
jgi:hypothetical protein